LNFGPLSQPASTTRLQVMIDQKSGE
jgi:hypothetical protein